MIDYLRVTSEAVLVEITSEPYVIYTSRGYAPVVDIINSMTQESHVLFIGSRSLSQRLAALQAENGNKLTGLEFWIRKESDDKMSPYLVELP